MTPLVKFGNDSGAGTFVELCGPTLMPGIKSCQFQLAVLNPDGVNRNAPRRNIFFYTWFYTVALLRVRNPRYHG